MTRERDRERENPLPPDAWVEVTTQFDEGDDALGHHMANALRTSGLLPSTTRPTLHQLGTP